MVSAIRRNSSALNSSVCGVRSVFRAAIDALVGNGNGPFSREVGKWTDGGWAGVMFITLLRENGGSKLFDRLGTPRFGIRGGAESGTPSRDAESVKLHSLATIATISDSQHQVKWPAAGRGGDRWLAPGKTVPAAPLNLAVMQATKWYDHRLSDSG